MVATVGKYVLEGRSGVYVIHCYCLNKHHVIDVGKSDAVKTRVENYDRKDWWNKNCA